MKNGYKLPFRRLQKLSSSTVLSGLKKYFDKFGDRAPNRFETYLIITARRVVYRQYVDEFTRSNRKFVQESVFTNIWNAVFPRYIDRPWCDIPGNTAIVNNHSALYNTFRLFAYVNMLCMQGNVIPAMRLTKCVELPIVPKLRSS